MNVESNVDDIALLEKADKSPADYLELQRRAFLTTKTRRALEKEVDTLRHAHDAGDIDPASTARYGVYLVLLGHHQEATQVLESCGKDETARFFCGRALRELGRYRQAATLLQPIAKKGNPIVAQEFIEAMIAAGQVDEATTALEQLFGASGDPANRAYLSGLIADSNGDYEQALEFYEQALAAEPTHLKARFRLAFNYDLRGLDSDARNAYLMLRDSQPPHANALINLGVIYEDAGEYVDAVDCYERVLEAYPNHERARLFLKDAQASINEVVDEDRERRNDELALKLRVPITDFELSVRSRNCLAKMEIKTLGDLVQKSESELLSYKNFGETSLSEIKEILSSKNLRLGMNIDGPDAMRLFSSAVFSSEEIIEEDDPAAEVLDKPIDFLELSVRSRKAMDRLGIATVGELVQQTENSLMSQKNFGQTSMNEVKSKLAQYALKLSE